jgi:hypothetical protein
MPGQADALMRAETEHTGLVDLINGRRRASSSLVGPDAMMCGDLRTQAVASGMMLLIIAMNDNLHAPARCVT